MLLVIFLISPVITGIILSLQKTSFTGEADFTGIRNYTYLFQEERFLQNVGLSLIYVFGNLFLSLPVAYVTALLISSKIRGHRFFRSFYLIPWIIAPVVSAVLFRSLVNPLSGPVSLFVEKITGSQKVFLAGPVLAMLVVIVHSFWRSFPFMMLFLSAGIAAIPKEVYEAAEVDGVNRWNKFRYITFPLTRLHLTIILLIITMWTLQDAETIYALTEGGPGYSTEVTAVRLFKESFINFDLNIGAAIGIILVLVSVFIMLIYLRLTFREELSFRKKTGDST